MAPISMCIVIGTAVVFLVKNPYFDRKLIGKIIYKANVTLEGTALFCPLLRSAPDVEACNTTLQFAKNKGNGDFKNVFGKSKYIVVHLFTKLS